MSNFIFTSESVSEGHPDKMADQISDAILDAMLAADPESRVACETLVKTGMVVIAGEVTCEGYVDIADVVRKLILEIGYDSDELGFDGRDCAVLISIDQQSEDIRHGVDEDKLFISTITVDEGPTMKRWRPRAMGRATRIRKRTSHICVGVEEER